MKHHDLHSEVIQRRLVMAMAILIVSLLSMSIPFVIHSYQSYRQSEKALSEMAILRQLTSLSNQISRERAPSNKAMSSTMAQLPIHLSALYRYRAEVNLHIRQTVALLNQHGFPQLAEDLQQRLTALSIGRQAVDHYIQLPAQQRNAEKLDDAIQKMFSAWDSLQPVLQTFISQDVAEKSDLLKDYVAILLLSDLRDQAGRMASNIFAAVTFQEKIPEMNVARALQTQHQSYYLWTLIHHLQLQQLKTAEYCRLHQKVKEEFIDTAIPIVANLITENHHHQPFSLNGVALTQALIEKFATVVQLQTYLIDQSVPLLQQQYSAALSRLVVSVMIAVIALMAAFIALFYTHTRIFKPLIELRQKLLGLLAPQQADVLPINPTISLFDAIQNIRHHLQQRDTIELQLQYLAHTDALTGIANRLALAHYIHLLERHPGKFLNTGLLILDIDDLKKINDSAGHRTGDQVIQYVATQLNAYVTHCDIVVRYGGDEFILIVKTTHLNHMLSIAEKIRHKIASKKMTITTATQEVMTLSVSIGIAMGALTWHDLFYRADQSLLKAKAAGKNTISV